MLVIANIFQPLIDVFESVLVFFHDNVGLSWGLSIIALTVAVRAVLLPLTFRQIKSMVRMQVLAPQMKEIQKKYKSDKQRQQEEMMKFYRENNVNPLASCLPMVAQLPVFISLYYMLRETLRDDICPGVQHVYRVAYAAHHNITMAAAQGQTTACGSHGGSSFLFIHDLTAKATGIELGILIVLYVGSQLGSSLLMSAASMDPTQRKIMMFMPIIFVLFVIRFPAGLLLYWITTNLWTVGQQYVVKRFVGPTQAAVVPAGGGGGSPGGSGAAADPGGSEGSDSGRSGGGGIGGRIRERLAAAQADAAASRSAKASGSGSGSGGAGGSRTATKSSPATSGSSGSSGASAKSAKRGADNGGGARATATKSKSKTSGDGSGNGSRSSSGSSTPPPRPPRKKKKRSGRRR